MGKQSIWVKIHMDIHCMFIFHHFSRWNPQLPVAKKVLSSAKSFRGLCHFCVDDVQWLGHLWRKYSLNMRINWWFTDDSPWNFGLSYFLQNPWKWCYKLISMLAKAGSIPYWLGDKWLGTQRFTTKYYEQKTENDLISLWFPGELHFDLSQFSH